MGMQYPLVYMSQSIAVQRGGGSLLQSCALSIERLGFPVESRSTMNGGCLDNSTEVSQPCNLKRLARKLRRKLCLCKRLRSKTTSMKREKRTSGVVVFKQLNYCSLIQG